MGLSFPWNEYVDNESPSDMTFDSEGASASLVLQCAWDDRYECIKQLLGYPYRAVIGSEGVLLRVLPLQHPIFHWLVAKRVSNIKGLSPKGKEAAAPHNNLQFGAKYEKARMTVEFWTPPYDLLSDADVGVNETLRFVTKQWRFVTEFLSLQQGAWLFADVASGSKGKPIPGGRGFLVSKTEMIQTWHQVPHACLFDGDDFPSLIQSAVGKLNVNDWEGCEAGTVLCNPPVIKPFTSPLAPGVLGATNRLWDVEFHLSHFDPPVLGTVHGWNTAPIPGRGNKWSLFTDDGTLSGNRLYDSIDFYDVLFNSL